MTTPRDTNPSAWGVAWGTARESQRAGRKAGTSQVALPTPRPLLADPQALCAGRAEGPSLAGGQRSPPAFQNAFLWRKRQRLSAVSKRAAGGGHACSPGPAAPTPGRALSLPQTATLGPKHPDPTRQPAAAGTGRLVGRRVWQPRPLKDRRATPVGLQRAVCPLRRPNFWSLQIILCTWLKSTFPDC